MPDEETKTLVDCLIEETIKPVEDWQIPKLYERINERLKQRYSHREILNAWRVYKEKYWTTNKKIRFAKQIHRWLEEKDGFEVDIQQVKKLEEERETIGNQPKQQLTANDRYKECDIENCTNYLVKHSIKPTSDVDVPKIRQGVSNLCDKGYTTSQIADAWKLYCDRCHKNNPDTTRYVKPLLNWLNSQDGVFWDIRGTEKVKKRNSSEKIIAEPDSCADKPRQEHPIINDRYAKLCTEWDGRLTKMMRNDLVGEKEAAVQLAYELMPIHKEMCEIEKNAHVVIEHTEVRGECLASVLGDDKC